MGGIIRSTLWLTAGNLANRVIGLGYRLLLGRLLDPARLGLFQLAMSLYFSLLTPVVAGLPDAVARVTARSPVHPALPRVIARTAWVAVAGVALPAAWLLVTGWTPPGPGWVEARRAVPLALLLPAIALAAASAVLRGQFLGDGRSAWIVVAQLVEQLVRVGALFLAVHPGVVLPWPPLVFLVGLLIAGEAVGFLITLLAYRAVPPAPPDAAPRDPGAGGPPSLGEVLALAGPATVERILLSAARLVEATLIPTRLVQVGLTVTQALAVYGELGSLAAPLLLLPTVFSGALAASIVPAVAQVEHDPRRLREQVRRVVAVALHLGVLAAVLFRREGGALAALLFPDAAGGDYPGAGRLIHWVAPAALLLYTDQVAAAVMRGLGRPLEPMLVDLTSAAVRVAVIAWGIRPGMDPEAAVRMVCLSVVVDVAVAGCGNLTCALWRTGTRPDLLGWLVLPACAGLAAEGLLNGLGAVLGPGLAGRLASWTAAALAVAIIAWVAAIPARRSRPALPA
ncbi:polysaccharide biosynthesis protein [Thermaerobacter marianensis DSM 12885]|uniref:Polysaccharide biosynthesis protein n=1 Tax=Thermaerobacter marianensis (strain ATCC 700841 / DSM 12885 / JCM 10246 / 7p75a) TaxID=644966 RepID=E6SMB9_THEM7|nr:oligosaccharide flippase family protein [Thermaerobacter marianensis]ADU51478.1 polysaccharide biosynthesis protein [Thermaerobacter marianensis DSM 12885]